MGSLELKELTLLEFLGSNPWPYSIGFLDPSFWVILTWYKLRVLIYSILEGHQMVNPVSAFPFPLFH